MKGIIDSERHGDHKGKHFDAARGSRSRDGVRTESCGEESDDGAGEGNQEVAEDGGNPEFEDFFPGMQDMGERLSTENKEVQFLVENIKDDDGGYGLGNHGGPGGTLDSQGGKSQ